MITYNAGNANTSATFTVTVEKDGCTQTCSYTITTCTLDEHPDGEEPGNPDDGEDPGNPGDGEDPGDPGDDEDPGNPEDRKSTRLNSSHVKISYAVFCLKKNI